MRHDGPVRPVLLLAMVAACSMKADFAGTEFLCDEDPDCPGQQTCIAGRCGVASLVPDAGRIDAGLPTLLGWNTGAALPAPRDYNQPHAGYARGFLYLVGGYDGAEQTTVFRTEVEADGSLVGWSETTALPQPRANGDLAVVGNRIYLVGGAGASAALSSVYLAPVNANGSLGSWSLTTSLPAPRKGLVVFAAGDYLYAVGGEDDGGQFHTTAYVTRIEPDGDVGAWTETTPLPEPRAAAAGIYADGAIYLLGGVNPATTIHATAFVAPVDVSGGAIGAWSSTTDLPSPRRSATAFAWGGHIYLAAGVQEKGTTAEVLHATIGSQHQLGDWQVNTALPAPRGRHASALVDGVFYVIAGIGASGGEVFYTRTE
jgi:hypothetical protein